MYRRIVFIIGVVLFLAAILAGCNLAIGAQATPTAAVLDPTNIAATVFAELTIKAPPTATIPLASATPADTATPQFTATASATATIAFTSTPSIPMISASKNTNCRTGPGVVYPVVGYLLLGDTSQVMGRLADNSWWVIQNPNRPGQVCWVWNQTTSVSGDTGLLPVATPPPTPTPTNTPTITKTPTVTWTPTITLTPTPTWTPTP